ncbi:VCBS repeat-containing protein [Verrucomicrobiaceae bacterium N1E253]|uniref:VCBS repeat-containing protein n=1 Tax=Oceaniferula marina TaxID=2748318 RepID=A0A851GB12_9BACT|nr:VCBS repeat-containing protein [Oceaniferula marina]NWK54948.1 VCBS repeat-containing protein [Oceaniferula marina]
MRRFLILYFLCSYIPIIAAPLDRQEELSSQAGGALKHLGQWMKGEIPRDQLAQDLASNFHLNIDFGNTELTPHKGGLIVSGTADASLAKKAHHATSLKRFKELIRGKILRTKFKIIEVVVDDEQSNVFRTRQLVALFIKTDNGFREINTEWLAHWKLAGENVQLVKLTGGLDDDTRLTRESLMFEDLTTSVLRLNEDENTMIYQGANHWLQRIEAALKPEFFALNGLSVADVNEDGREDVYVCQLGGLPNMLMLQQADGSFINAAHQSGIDFMDNSTCALFVDFDNDGDQDMALATSAGVAILANDSTGHFKRIKLLKDVRYCYSLCAADYDQDGLVDLYACRYYGDQTVRKGQQSVQGNIPVPHPVYNATNGGRNTLLKNTGELGFKNVTDQVGLNQHNNRFTYAAHWDDWDNDGDQDLYVANDFGQNNLYQNNRGVFTEVTKEAGLISGEFSMGACSGDFNGDGNMDIHVSNMFSSAGSRVTRQAAFKSGTDQEMKNTFQLLAKGNTLSINQGDGRFKAAGDDTGIRVGRWSWASLAADINNDSWDDLLVANGFITGKEMDDL